MIKNILLALMTATMVSCGDNSSVNTSVTGTSLTTISGSAGDGPITGAAITVTDSNGNVVITTPVNPISDNSAHFSFSVPASTVLPITIIVSGGTDLVTGKLQDFPLKTTVVALPTSGKVEANASPLSTLIVESAKNMVGGITPKNIAVASTNVSNTLNFGFPSGSGAINTAVNNANIAAIIKANEGVAELIRRVSVSSGQSLNSTIATLAADIADGALDGAAVSSASSTLVSQLFAGIAVIQQAIISSELLTNSMAVTTPSGTVIPSASGTNFVKKMNGILAKIQPSLNAMQADVSQVAVTASFIHQSYNAISVVSKFIGGSSSVNTIQSLLKNLQPGSIPSATQQTLLYAALNSSSIQLNQAISDVKAGVAIVFDAIPPVVVAPVDIIIEATGVSTPVTLGVATVTDNIDAGLTAVASPSGPYTVGTHNITWSATDLSGNTGSATQVVTITDTTPPSISFAGNMPTTIAQGSVFSSPGASALDLVDGVVPITVSSSVNTSVLGTYNITYNAMDAHHNIASRIITIHVTDQTAPVVTAPANIAVTSSGTSTVVLLGTATVLDNVNTSLVATPFPTGPYTIGKHDIIWSATDAAGNIGVASQIVMVIPPVTTTAATVHYTYDANGRITAASYSSGTVVTYTYNAEGSVISEIIQ